MILDLKVLLFEKLKFELKITINQVHHTSMQDPNKRPISPQELFQRLLNGNFKEAECVDQVARIREERTILIQLISEYEAEIARRKVDRDQLDSLLELRARLRIELQNVRDQRISIDRNIADEVMKFKLTPVEIREIHQWKGELDELRCKNTKVAVRIKQLSDYAAKMERYNAMLEQERRIHQQQLIPTREKSYSMGGECCENWRQKIRALKKDQEIFTNEVRLRMKEKEESSVRQMRLREEEIAERNRLRIQSFRASTPLAPYYPNI